MSLEDPLFYMRKSATGPAIPDLTVVALRIALTLNDERILPADAEGTVVGSWDDGQGYIVEFDEPFHAVATVEIGQLREIVRFGD